jgi:hypothetical protein
LPDIATIATASPMTFLQQPTLMKVYVETPSKAPELTRDPMRVEYMHYLLTSS